MGKGKSAQHSAAKHRQAEQASSKQARTHTPKQVDELINAQMSSKQKTGNAESEERVQLGLV